jgi:hypothetical protein
MRIGLNETSRNHFFNAMFGKNLFFPKTKIIKIGLGVFSKHTFKSKKTFGKNIVSQTGS